MDRVTIITLAKELIEQPNFGEVSGPNVILSNSVLRDYKELIDSVIYNQDILEENKLQTVLNLVQAYPDSRFAEGSSKEKQRIRENNVAQYRYVTNNIFNIKGPKGRAYVNDPKYVSFNIYDWQWFIGWLVRIYFAKIKSDSLASSITKGTAGERAKSTKLLSEEKNINRPKEYKTGEFTNFLFAEAFNKAQKIKNKKSKRH